jgi:hypothetical protein
MIMARIMGGLGNQLFQYAAGKSLAARLGAELCLDVTWFKSNKQRVFHLPFLNIESRLATRKEIQYFIDRPVFMDRLHKWIHPDAAMDARRPSDHSRRHEKPRTARKGLYYKEPHFHYDKAFQSLSGDVCLDGYWQSEKYFQSIAGVIRKQFTVRTAPDAKNLEFAQGITSCESVGLHLRRGDYATNPELHLVHGLCDAQYYFQAVKHLLSELQAPEFFVFTDDPEWARQNLQIPSPFVVVDHNGAQRDYEDLRLLSLCKHTIMANSTFSWWGAWLNANKSKRVIAPGRWFRVEMDESDLIPDGWRRLRNPSSPNPYPSHRSDCVVEVGE